MALIDLANPTRFLNLAERLLPWLAGLTAFAIVSGRPTAIVGSAAGAGCLTLGLLLLVYKEALIGHEAHLEPRQDGIPW